MIIEQFSINYKEFKGKFKGSIENGIIKKYSELYENVVVSYKKFKNIFKFVIFADLDVFDKNMNKVKMCQVITNYSNIEAIMFADIDKDEYYKEYDDSKKDYLTELKNEVDSIILLYKLDDKNIDNINVAIDDKSFQIYIPSKSMWGPGKLLSKKFAFKNMLTLEEKNHYITETKQFLRKSVQ